MELPWTGSVVHSLSRLARSLPTAALQVHVYQYGGIEFLVDMEDDQLQRIIGTLLVLRFRQFSGSAACSLSRPDATTTLFAVIS